jgi:ABC-type uncharacterized transport system auxiliary subunit
VAEVELGGKIIDGKGRIVGTQVFRGSAPAKSSDAAGAVAGVDQAMSNTGPDFVAWVARAIAEQTALKPVEKKKAQDN